MLGLGPLAVVVPPLAVVVPAPAAAGLAWAEPAIPAVTSSPAAAAAAVSAAMRLDACRAARAIFMVFSSSFRGGAGVGGRRDQLRHLVGVGHHRDVAGRDLDGGPPHPAGETTPRGPRALPRV